MLTKALLPLLLVFGCSSDDQASTANSGSGGLATAGGPGSNRGGGSAQGGATSATQANAGGATATTTLATTAAGTAQGPASDCPAVPRAKLFPWIGVFIYGPNPGPCTDTQTMNTNYLYGSAGNVTTSAYRLNYDAQGVLLAQLLPDGTSGYKFSYAQGLLTSATNTTVTGTIDFRYTYSDATHVSFSQGASYTDPSSVNVTAYTLDTKGYPLSAEFSGPALSNGVPARWVYQYDHCRIQRRVSFGADGSELTNFSASYSYDDLGRVTRVQSLYLDNVYDYSCW